jgi:mannose-6-phosphate isomerase class I
MTSAITIGQHPIVLQPIKTAKSWGSEEWLNSARPEAPARVPEAAGEPTLAALIAAEPALLGRWPRRLFGDELPIFTKFIYADFPPLVHVGFKRAVERQALLGWLGREQALLRQLFSGLQVETRAAFDEFSRIYSNWATEQAEARWQREDDAAFVDRLRPLERAEALPQLSNSVVQLRQNRAQLVEVLNEVDLRREAGNLLLTPAGVVHAIFGLSHQTHPLDRTRATLQAVLRNCQRLAQAGASDDEIAAVIDAAGLDELRRTDRDAPKPKNEGWFPTSIGGRLALVEPQQSSDTTYSLADFYTPFVFSDGRLRFRKGDPSFGILSSDLETQLLTVELGATPLDEIRRAPVLLGGAGGPRARLFRLVDDGVAWPFFTAYQLELDGEPGSAARFSGDHAPGVFQQIVVLDGEVELADAHGGRARLSSAAPAFIPATLTGGYELAANGAARVLLFSVPGPRSAFPGN